MEFQLPNLLPVAAEILLATAALGILLLTAFFRRETGARIAFFLSLTTLLVAGVFNFRTMDQVDFTFGQMFFDDAVGDLIKSASCLGLGLVMIYGRAYLQARERESAEYYVLLLLGGLGVCVLASAGSLLTVYLGLELLALSSYALVAIDRDSVRATEAAMKYFVLGALASGLLLYGMSMIYGATLSLDLVEIARSLDPAMTDVQTKPTVLLFGLVFLVVGVAFKLGLAPFHMWVPDVYEGAPTPVTLFIASVSKLAAFAMAYRLLAIGMWDLAQHWQRMLLITGLASIVLGNLAAVAQTNLKRMLAYSGISHMGFLVLSLASGVVQEDRSMAVHAYVASLYYAMVYVLSALAAFGIMLLMSRKGFEAENLQDFRGLNARSGWWAAMMAVAMFSMAGIPFFVGFFAKFYVLERLVAAGYLWIAVVAVLMSFVGAYYYLRVIKVMYFDAPEDLARPEAGWAQRCLLSANALALIFCGLFPGYLLDLCAYVVYSSI